MRSESRNTAAHADQSNDWYVRKNMNDIAELLADAKSLARKYRKLTGKSLGITGEVAELSAAQLLGLELAAARQPGFDATRSESGKVTKIQIKGRCVPANAKPGRKLGRIQLDKEWDVVLLVLMDEDFDVQNIYEAERLAIEEALRAPGSRARNERGVLSVSKFKAIGSEVWNKNSKERPVPDRGS